MHDEVGCFRSLKFTQDRQAGNLVGFDAEVVVAWRFVTKYSASLRWMSSIGGEALRAVEQRDRHGDLVDLFVH